MSHEIETLGIIGGDGAFGTLTDVLCGRFAPHVRVKLHSQTKSRGNKRYYDLAAVVKCDAVVVAVPIRVYEEVLHRIKPMLGEHSILVDVATVKMHPSALCRELFPAQPRLNIHAMFGPGSYKKSNGDVKGFPIVVTEHSLFPDQYARMIRFAQSLGFDVIEMTSEEHDRRLSETLFIAHLQSQTLKRGKLLETTSFDTPSVRLMKEAAEIVANDTELFRDVVHFNPFCRDAMIRYMQAQSFIWDLLHDAK